MLLKYFIKIYKKTVKTIKIILEINYDGLIQFYMRYVDDTLR